MDRMLEGLERTEQELQIATEKLLAADSNSALTSINKALVEIRDLRIYLSYQDGNKGGGDHGVLPMCRL